MAWKCIHSRSTNLNGLKQSRGYRLGLQSFASENPGRSREHRFDFGSNLSEFRASARRGCHLCSVVSDQYWDPKFRELPESARSYVRLGPCHVAPRILRLESRYEDTSQKSLKPISAKPIRDPGTPPTYNDGLDQLDHEKQVFAILLSYRTNSEGEL